MDSKEPYAKCWMCTLIDEPFVPSEIRTDAPILVVGEAPGADEVRLRAPFVGISGQLLNAAITNCGHSREELSLTNTVCCRPPNNREPTTDEIYACHERLVNTIRVANPQRVLALGKTAREALAPTTDSYRGWGEVTLDGTKRPMMSTWHPAYVYRRPSEAPALLRDIVKAFEGPQQYAVTTAPEPRIMETYEQLAATLSTAPEGAWVAYDLETNQVTWYDRPGKKANSILMLGLTWDTSMAVIIGDELLYDDPRTADLLNEFFKHVRPTGHNIKFDNIFLRSHLGINVVAQFDSLLAHYILDENSRHGLKVLAFEEFGLPDYEKELISEYLRSANDEYSKIPFQRLAAYCAWDVSVTLELTRVFEARLYKEGLLYWPFEHVHMAANEAMTRQQIRGVQVDIDYLQRCSDLFAAEIERTRLQAGQVVGSPDINLNSPAQVGAVLWDDLGLPQSGNRKVKDRSTNELAVMHLRGKHPFVDLLMYHRRLHKLKSGYIDNMIEFIDVSGRIHPDVLLYGTEIGRISMRDPAVQTIPRPDDPTRKGYNPYEDGAVIRGAIVAAPGNVFVACDFSQAELRTLAYMSKDPFLLSAYAEGRDIHSEVAEAMFGPDFTKEQRVQCKMFNFSYVYGGTEYSFAEDAGLPISVARAFVRRYDTVMPVARAWKVEQLARLKREGYVATLFNQRRRFPLITPENQDDARKASVHAVIAGTAAAVTVMAQTELIMEGVPIVMSVHDSIEADSPEELADEHTKRIAEVMMETASKYMSEVPWKVDSEIGYRWVEPPELSLLEQGYTKPKADT